MRGRRGREEARRGWLSEGSAMTWLLEVGRFVNG